MKIGHLIEIPTDRARHSGRVRGNSHIAAPSTMHGNRLYGSIGRAGRWVSKANLDVKSAASRRTADTSRSSIENRIVWKCMAELGISYGATAGAEGPMVSTNRALAFGEK